MSKLLSKPTPTVENLAKKYKVSVIEVKKQLLRGIKVEKEHTNNAKIAREIALDHLGEKLDYYKKLAKIDEETGVGGVRGLGNVTGDPAISGNDYINTNALADDPLNGARLQFVDKTHNKLHSKNLFKSYDPKNIKNTKNFVSEGISAGPEREIPIIGSLNGSSRKLSTGVDVDKEQVKEDLRKWFREKWVRYDTKGNIKGPCARDEGEGKPKCRPLASARAMSKDERAKSARRKRREDPVADRPGKGGKPINVQTEETQIDELHQDTIWDYSDKALTSLDKSRKVGYKNDFSPKPGKKAAAARKTFDKRDRGLAMASKRLGGVFDEETLLEKNVPTNPALWARAKAQAKAKFDVYPSAYANGWASKWYKSKGGGWKSAANESIDEACWATHKQVGWKKKGKKMVPDCVLKNENALPQTTQRGIYQESSTDKIQDYTGEIKIPATINEISANTVGAVSNARFWRGEPASRTLNRAIIKKFIESGKEEEKKKEVKEDYATALQHMNQPQAAETRAAQKQVSKGISGTARFGQQGAGARPMQAKAEITHRLPTRGGFGQVGAGPSSGVSPTKMGTSFSQGGGQVAQKMARSSPSQFISKMSDAGRQASVVASKVAPSAAKIAGTALRAAGGPAATAAAAVLSPTPAGEKKSEFQRQADVSKGISYKAQGRSISDYEKDVLTPKASETPKAPENPKVDVPTPPERPKYFSRGQAFQAARGEAGGGSGEFSYQSGSDTEPKSYQTNVKGEPYKPEKQLKQTSVQEDWSDAKYKSPSGGLTQAGVDAYNRETGGHLKTAVTTKPSKLKKGSKAAKRRKSFCARMGGMKKRLTSAKTANDPDSRINKALRKWNCEESLDINNINTFYKETKMDNKDLINEAIESIVENDLPTMKENLMAVLQEKAIEKLEERKKEIAAQYFAQ